MIEPSKGVQLDGFHAVKHALRFAPDLVRSITVADTALAARLAGELAPDIGQELLRRADVGPVRHPTGVTGTADRPSPDRSVLRTRRAPLVLLDDPRHPGNVGAVVRVAAAAGAAAVVVGGPLDAWHPAVLRGSAGLHFALPVLQLPRFDDEVDATVTGPLLVLDAGGGPLGEVPDDAVLVVGSERAGVGAALRSRADRVVALPMRPGVSSLNLATAVAAVLYRWRLG